MGDRAKTLIPLTAVLLLLLLTGCGAEEAANGEEAGGPADPEKDEFSLIGLLPTAATLLVVIIALWGANKLMLWRATPTQKAEGGFRRQVILLVLTAVGVVVVLITLPVEAATRNQLLTLVSIALTAVIALSSTTFVANAMAGVMLRSVGSYKPGDFIRVDEDFGRVTEIGLFHTEIQNRRRNLVTLPNLFLISRPFTVIRNSGTIISANVSLGYDTSHRKIAPLLIQAAEKAGLEKPFAQIRDLGDYSVIYRVAGLLKEVKQLMTIRSKLRRCILGTLHDAGIEIASPAIMNQRRIPEDEPIIPAPDHGPQVATDAEEGHEADVFDKAELAGQAEELKRSLVEIEAEAKELKAKLAKAEEADAPGIESEIALKKRQADYYRKKLQRLESWRDED
jgi:small-conductance mechanosensitive channel